MSCFFCIFPGIFCGYLEEKRFYALESGSFIKKNRRAREMKKRYRVIIDYEVDINEKVRVPDSEEIRAENLEKMKEIIDAFIDHPDIMNEYHKLRFFECVMVPDVSADMGELFQVKTFDAIMNSLGQHLPRETASYLISLFCCSSGNEYEGTDEDLSIEFDLILSLLGELVPFRASFKEKCARCMTI
jgi:hypothetical protein